MANNSATPARLFGTSEELRERVRQMRAAGRWEEFEDPLRVRSPDEALHWSGLVLEWRRSKGDVPGFDDGSGLIRMRECLAKLHPKT